MMTMFGSTPAGVPPIRCRATVAADGTFTLSGVTVQTRRCEEKPAHDTLIVHEDGMPGTRHVTTNIFIGPTNIQATKSTS
jgi:hypothetical protein